MTLNHVGTDSQGRKILEVQATSDPASTRQGLATKLTAKQMVGIGMGKGKRFSKKNHR